MGGEYAHDALAMVEYGDNPAVLLLADGDAARERAARAAELCGCRISGSARIAEGVTRLDRQANVDAVLVELDEDHGEALDRLLERLDADARALRYGVVIAAPENLIDAVSARTPSLWVQQLCRPSEIERVTAVALAAARAPERLHDVRRNGGVGRLQQLSEEVGRIAHILAHLSEFDETETPLAKPISDEPVSSGQVRAIIRARRLRDQYFPADFFADPAWDMLLDLVAARIDGQRVAVSSLCIAAAVPPTTALRWIKTLTDHGVLIRSNDPQDGRRVYIALSDRAASGMAAYLAAAQRISPIAV